MKEIIRNLELLADAQNAKLWAEEAIRRDKECNADPTAGRLRRDVLRDAFAKLK